MARPTKDTVNFFPHFVKGGRTIFILENKFGNDGYAFWFKLLELLCDSDGQTFDCSQQGNWQYLLARSRVDAQQAEAIIAELVNIGKIDGELWRNKRTIWVQNLVNNLAPIYRKRKEAAPTRADYGTKDTEEQEFPERKSDENAVSAPETRQRRVEKSRVEKNKEKKIYPYEDIVRLWNDTCPSLPKVQKLSDSRRNKIRQRLDEFGKDREAWMATAETLFEEVEASDFLRGNNAHSWKATFDWLFENSNNWVKVLEGNYANKDAAKPQQPGSPRLGVGEFIKDGRRTYGTGVATIPMSAPPRPSDRYMWNAEQQNWMLL